MTLADAMRAADSDELVGKQAEVLELIASGAPLDAVLTAVVRALEGFIPGSRCSILLLDRERGVLVHGAAPSLPLDYTVAIDGLVIGPDAGSCGTAAYLGRAVVAQDIDTDPRWDAFRGAARPHGMRSCWSSPIRGLAGVLGTFAVYSDEPHRPDEREEQLVGRFTHLAAVAIERAELFGALADSEERFRRAFEDNAVGMALTRVDGTIVKANRALTELFGGNGDDLLGSSMSDWLIPDVPEGAGPGAEADADARGGVTGLLHPLHHSEVVQFRATTTPAVRRRAELEVTASAVRGRDRHVGMLCVNVLDVTLRRAAARERRARREAELARVAAEDASRAKSEFVSALSHELRTPMQAITGFTELLGTLDLGPDRRQAALAHISSATTHVLSIVDDVLDLAKIEASALPLHVEPVTVDDVAHEVTALLETLAATAHVRRSVVGQAPAALADRRRLRQVLINLVTNGIQYNRRGGWVEVRLGSAPDGWSRLEVADSGQGVDPQLVERMFVPFDRLGAAAPGNGLGMALVKGLVERMGGRLDVSSEVGRGTVVTVDLPAATAAPRPRR